MHFLRTIPRSLDDEHRATLVLLDRLERTLTRGGDAELAALVRPLLHQLDNEVEQHFAFEEDALFPRLRAAGDGDIATLLTEEHADIRELCAELRPLAPALADGVPGAEQRATFKRLALELVERMVSHIQKESMGLLPLLEDLLDEDSDRELALAYVHA